MRVTFEQLLYIGPALTNIELVRAIQLRCLDDREGFKTGFQNRIKVRKTH